MDRKDWMLLAIYCAKKHGLTQVQLQKSLFLLGEKLDRAVGPRFYKFVPYNFGPFDKQIYTDAESLQVDGLIKIDSPPGQRVSNYSITPKGKIYIKSLKREVGPKHFEFLQKLVEVIRKATFAQLLRAIYKNFPQYKARSVFEE